jgi:hypothetical protein
MSQVRFVGAQLGGLAPVFVEPRFAVEERLVVVSNEASHCRTGFYCRAGSVRLQHAIVECGEARIDRRFIPEYIVCCAVEAMVANMLPVTVSNASRDVQSKRDATKQVAIPRIGLTTQ